MAETELLRAIEREEVWLAGDWDSRSARGIATMYRHRDRLGTLRQAVTADEERAAYDQDDRRRCRCTRHAPEFWGTGSIDGAGRCLQPTRHPTGKCVDCRRTER